MKPFWNDSTCFKPILKETKDSDTHRKFTFIYVLSVFFIVDFFPQNSYFVLIILISFFFRYFLLDIFFREPFYIWPKSSSVRTVRCIFWLRGSYLTSIFYYFLILNIPSELFVVHRRTPVLFLCNCSDDGSSAALAVSSLLLQRTFYIGF